MGFECGRRLLAIADHVLLVDRDEASVLDAARELSAETGNRVTVEPFVLDVTDREGLHRLAERTRGYRGATGRRPREGSGHS
jgi:NAD(P)-dependent dehydrogenase (short-subunit alcohol dehydrogenase family)